MARPITYPASEWTMMASPIVAAVTRTLAPREFQKSVTSMASAKFEKSQVLGRQSMLSRVLDISLGCLKAMTIVR